MFQLEHYALPFKLDLPTAPGRGLLTLGNAILISEEWE